MNAFKLTKAQYALQTLRDQRLKVALIHELNDPFELYGAALTERAHRTKFRAFKDWAAKQYGIMCFSRSWRNPVLWSHYADNHRGIAIEFKLHDDIVCPVSYETGRLLLDVKGALRRGSFTENEAFSLATTKFAHWQYEDEVRIFCRLEESIIDGSLRFEPFTERMRPVGVVLGPACTVTLKEIRESLPRGRQVAVTRTRLAFNSFNVVRDRRHSITVVHGAA